MSRKAQRRATRRHRQRATVRGWTRIEVQARHEDAGLIRGLAQALRAGPERADGVRSLLVNALADPQARTALDIFGSELADETFAGIFDDPADRESTA